LNRPFLPAKRGIQAFNCWREEVLITAPGKNDDGTFVVGVNHHDYDRDSTSLLVMPVVLPTA